MVGPVHFLYIPPLRLSVLVLTAIKLTARYKEPGKTLFVIQMTDVSKSNSIIFGDQKEKYLFEVELDNLW